MELAIERVKDVIYEITQDNDAYYLPAIDRFVFSSDDDIDLDDYSGRIVPLPSRQQINGYRMMEDFIEERVTGDPQDWLRNAIRGKGAFHRFRITCERFGLLKDWYDFEDTRYEDIAVNWCEENGYEYYFERKARGLYEEDIREVTEKKENVRIVKIDEKNAYVLGYMVIEFRKELAALRDWQSETDLEGAQEEIKYYLSKHYPILAASISGNYVGYAVIKEEDGIYWLESIYVRKEFRRRHIATMLLKEAEKIAQENGEETLYINIHPNNAAVINLLGKNGYDVLNLIEVRKKYPAEKLKTEYLIGDVKFKY
ncbi:MAG: GNAT family N-acetyltransferase [Erysipelotrichaceae bacterium]|nr:GNAT family N-acetyltransferase [Erysipelotrichaceae bacterium]